MLLVQQKILQGKVDTSSGKNSSFYSYIILETTDNGHPERAFFQKFETFGLGQTNWAEIL